MTEKHLHACLNNKQVRTTSERRLKPKPCCWPSMVTRRQALQASGQPAEASESGADAWLRVLAPVLCSARSELPRRSRPVALRTDCGGEMLASAGRAGAVGGRAALAWEGWKGT